MKYYLHDSNSFNDEKITELFISFGYEGLGLFYTILEKLAQQEKPIKTNVLKAQLKVGKKLQKCWEFMESIELISSNNGETFNNNLLNFSGKYSIKKEKTRERVSQWRERQELKKNVTCYESVCNNHKVNKSKVNESKHTNTIFSFDEFWETYNKKTGRINCERIYARLKDKDYAKIKETLPIYLASLNGKDKKFQMNPQTYLNGRYWEDEIYQQEAKKTEPTPSVPYEGFNPLSIDLSKLKPIR